MPNRETLKDDGIKLRLLPKSNMNLEILAYIAFSFWNDCMLLCNIPYVGVRTSHSQCWCHLWPYGIDVFFLQILKVTFLISEATLQANWWLIQEERIYLLNSLTWKIPCRWEIMSVWSSKALYHDYAMPLQVGQVISSRWNGTILATRFSPTCQYVWN